jgi:molybdenum cofactor guanylyltransferase
VIGGTNCAGFVLAGGASSRFGRDKALVAFGREVLLTRLCNLLRSLNLRAVAVVGAAEKYSRATGDVPCIADRWPGEGPLGGIITAISTSLAKRSATPEWNLIVGCDMPFLTRHWLEYIAERANGESVAEVVIPVSAIGLEPLCACWRTSALEVLQREFARGTRRVTDAMKHLRVEILDESHWKRFDSGGLLFWNMNTPADYEEAKRLIETEQL